MARHPRAASADHANLEGTGLDFDLDDDARALAAGGGAELARAALTTATGPISTNAMSFPWGVLLRPFRRGRPGLGISIPEEYGGGGKGILEAALLMETIAVVRRGDERLQLDAPDDLRPQHHR